MTSIDPRSFLPKHPGIIGSKVFDFEVGSEASGSKSSSLYDLQADPHTDQVFMYAALKEACCAFEEGEVPVGAVLVFDGRIIARGHNQVEQLHDATAHAEMLCLTAGAASLNNWRLLKTTLYCTVEPCAMCAGAMLLSRVGRLVWGAPDLRHGANGSWVDLLGQKHPMHEICVERGVYQEEAARLMQVFFQNQRKQGE